MRPTLQHDPYGLSFSIAFRKPKTSSLSLSLSLSLLLLPQQKQQVIQSNQVQVRSAIIMETQIPDDGGERTETSGAEELNSCEDDINAEPCEGMLFASEEAAKAFYDDYAKRVGFSTRVLSSRKSERDGSIISRGLGCRGGSDKPKDRGQTLKRDRRRDGCTAMVLVKREMLGKWVVRKFVRDHSHSLVVELPRTRPTPDEKDKKIQELTAELRVKKRLSAAYRDQLLRFMKDVEDHNVNLSTKVQVAREKLVELEAKRQDLLHHR